MQGKTILFLLLSCVLGLVPAMIPGAQDREPEPGDPVVGSAPQRVEDEYVPEPPGVRVETWASGLEVPWSLVFLPDGRALVTERPGRIRLIRDGRLQEEPYMTFEVDDRGEGGLMGIASHPGFPGEPYLYVMYTTETGGEITNRVERLVDRGDHAEPDRVIIDDIPGSGNHNGGRVSFGPDGMLYITTGDNFDAETAQDPESLAGKILRLEPDGSIPDDNPFNGSPVYSFGHRNPQGLAWHPETGELFSSEHGPSGEFGLGGMDIVNVIEAGENYGWPLVLGAADVEPYRDPVIMWEEATPPGGMAFHDSVLYIATLRSEALVKVELSKKDKGFDILSIDRLFADGPYSGKYGRLRDVIVGPDGALYVLTSNRDGRGNPAPDDDRILRLTLRDED